MMEPNSPTPASTEGGARTIAPPSGSWVVAQNKPEHLSYLDRDTRRSILVMPCQRLQGRVDTVENADQRPRWKVIGLAGYEDDTPRTPRLGDRVTLADGIRIARAEMEGVNTGLDPLPAVPRQINGWRLREWTRIGLVYESRSDVDEEIAVSYNPTQDDAWAATHKPGLSEVACTGSTFGSHRVTDAETAVRQSVAFAIANRPGSTVEYISDDEYADHVDAEMDAALDEWRGMSSSSSTEPADSNTADTCDADSQADLSQWT